MNILQELGRNGCLWAGLLAWAVAQGLKIPIHRLTHHEWDLHQFFSAGGMPSSHSASAVCVAISVGVRMGFNSPVFALAFLFAAIVMYDAAGVRRETGRQGQAINDILASVLVDGKPISDEELKEIVGHSPFEVAMGAITGLLVSVLFETFFG
ncbi:MAG: divergent PAP2 family protein [Clostridia bacterium]|nr:divergent PAP2 family protein [Clostridia bacterium]